MFFIRHGQSIFNAAFNQTGRDPGVRDAPLTARGLEQAQHTALSLKTKNITRIISSPYSRALQTAHEAAKVLNLPITAHPLVGERKLYSCDIGTPTSDLKRAWPEVDFTALEKEEWWPPHDESDEDIDGRVKAFLSIFDDKDASTTLVFSHWYFIFTLSGQDAENAQVVWRDAHGCFHRQ